MNFQVTNSTAEIATNARALFQPGWIGSLRLPNPIVMALRNLVQGLAPELTKRNIRIATATVSTLVLPDSPEAAGAADTLWTLATAADAPWEIIYPAA